MTEDDTRRKVFPDNSGNDKIVVMSEFKGGLYVRIGTSIASNGNAKN